MISGISCSEKTCCFLQEQLNKIKIAISILVINKTE